MGAAGSASQAIQSGGSGRPAGPGRPGRPRRSGRRLPPGGCSARKETRTIRCSPRCASQADRSRRRWRSTQRRKRSRCRGGSRRSGSQCRDGGRCGGHGGRRCRHGNLRCGTGRSRAARPARARRLGPRPRPGLLANLPAGSSASRRRHAVPPADPRSRERMPDGSSYAGDEQPPIAGRRDPAGRRGPAGVRRAWVRRAWLRRAWLRRPPPGPRPCLRPARLRYGDAPRRSAPSPSGMPYDEPYGSGPPGGRDRYASAGQGRSPSGSPYPDDANAADPRAHRQPPYGEPGYNDGPAYTGGPGVPGPGPAYTGTPGYPDEPGYSSPPGHRDARDFGRSRAGYEDRGSYPEPGDHQRGPGYQDATGSRGEPASWGSDDQSSAWPSSAPQGWLAAGLTSTSNGPAKATSWRRCRQPARCITTGRAVTTGLPGAGPRPGDDGEGEAW